MGNYDSTPIAKSDRIKRLVDHLYAKMPEIEAARAELITESFKATEGQPVVMRKARAFEHILKNLPIIIRPEELIVGSTTIAPRGCQTYPEFSYEWLEAEFETVETRSADPDPYRIHLGGRGGFGARLVRPGCETRILSDYDHA